jgi:Uma2 family endonuclease
MSIEEFAALPDEGLWELIDGEPIEMTPSAGRSSHTGGRIHTKLANHVEPSGMGWAFPADAGFILFDDRAVVRSPDAAFVRLDRLPTLPDGFIPLAPDFAVEVLSPSDRRADALAKVAMYLQAAVKLVWLVDPERRAVTVFRPDETIAVLHDGETLDAGDVVPGFSMGVSEMFA